MPLSRYKQEFKDKRVAFGKSAAPLYLREDLDELAVIALESGDKTLLDLFEHLPSLEELKKQKTDLELTEVRAALKEQKKTQKNKNK